MKKFITKSTEETEQLAQTLAENFKSGDVIAYKGPMGMGKTAFTRGLCRGLKIDDSEVSSPTFALVHQYEGEDLILYHFDMYRVDGVEDLYSTGFFDYLDYGGILAIEWSENIESALPANTTFITISAIEGKENSREITIEGDDRF